MVIFMGRSRGLIFGIGLNDANYTTYQKNSNGRYVACPFYVRWKSMLKRCYSSFHLKGRPTYEGCSVCDEWLIFSNFKAWMENQDWEGRHLDKDLLVYGNKIYSPDTCIFVSAELNAFILDSRATREGRLIGASYHETARKFVANCSNPISGFVEYLGLYINEIDAHIAWKNRKHELACQLADLQTDDRVANALRKRYAD